MTLATSHNLYRIRPEIWNELLTCQRILLNDQIFNRLQCVEHGYNFPLTYCSRRKPGRGCQECIYKMEGLADEIGVDYEPMSVYAISRRFGWRKLLCART